MTDGRPGIGLQWSAYSRPLSPAGLAWDEENSRMLYTSHALGS